MERSAGGDTAPIPGLEDPEAARRAGRRSVVIVLSMLAALVVVVVGFVGLLQLVPDEDVKAATACNEFKRNLRIAAPPFGGFDVSDLKHDTDALTGRWVPMGADMLAAAEAAAKLEDQADLDRAIAALDKVGDWCAEVPPVARIAARI